MRVLLLCPFALLAYSSAARATDLTVSYTSLASDLQDGAVTVDYEIPQDVWDELTSYGVASSILVWETRSTDNTRTFAYALPVSVRAGHLVTPVLDWTGFDGYDLEAGGWNGPYHVAAMWVGGSTQTAFHWALNTAQPAVAPPPPTVVDASVITACHDDLSYVGPGYVQQCTALMAGFEPTSAVSAIHACKSSYAQIGPGAILDCLKQASGR